MSPCSTSPAPIMRASNSCKVSWRCSVHWWRRGLLMTLVIHEWHVQRNPTSGHFNALDQDFMRTRLHIANRSLLEEIRV